MAHQHEQEGMRSKEHLGGDMDTPGILGVSGRTKPQEMTDNYSFAEQAQNAIDGSIKAATQRPLGQKPAEGGTL